MQSVVIVGGGISGISAAYYLSKLSKLYNKSIGKIILVESSDRLGGWVNTYKSENGALHELGPRSLRKAGLPGENTLQLMGELKLENDVLIKSNSDENVGNRYIASTSELCKMPRGILSFFFKQKPFSQPFYKFLLREFKTSKIDLSNQSWNYLGNEQELIQQNEEFLNEKLEDIDVHKMVRLRIGNEVANYFFDPLIRGITSGDARTISFRSMFEDFFVREREFGSIVRSILSISKNDSKKQKLNKNALLNNDLPKKLKKFDSNCICSFKHGMVQLPNAIADYLNRDSNVEIKLNHTLKEFEIDEEGKATLGIENAKKKKKIKADQVFLALNANDLSKLLSEDDRFKILKSTLASIKSASVATINIEIDKKNLLEKHSGFGFLIPSFVNPSILGVVFDSLVFPEHNKSNEITRLSVMAGGDWFSELCNSDEELDESKLLKKSSEVLYKYLGIKDDPSFLKINILKNCIPQYRVGHYLKLKLIEREIKNQNLKLSLIGSSYSGISLNHCIYNSKLKVESYLQQNK